LKIPAGFVLKEGGVDVVWFSALEGCPHPYA